MLINLYQKEMKLFSFKSILILCLFCIGSQNVYSQQRRLINYTEIGALLQHTNSLNNNSEFNGFRTRTGVTKIIDGHFGLGIALGTDNYRKASGSNYNTLPITINAAYYLKSDLSGLRGDVYGGYAVKLFNNFNRGLTAGAGISYAFYINNGLNLGIQTGYNYQKIDFPPTFIENGFNMGSFRLGLGITFK